MDDLKSIERIILRAPDDGEISDKYNLFIFRKGEMPEIRSYDEETEKDAIAFIGQVLKAKDYTGGEEGFLMGYNPKADYEKDNLVLAYVSKVRKNPNIVISDGLLNKIMGVKESEKEENSWDSEETIEDDLYVEDKKTPKWKRVLAGAGAATILAGAAAPLIINIAKSNDFEKELENNDELNNIDYSEESIEQLLSRLEDGSFAKKVYTKALNFCKNFNSTAAKEGNFHLVQDKDNYLVISAEEALYTSIVLNNYSADQIMEIFGTKTLDYNKVLEGYKSICEKIKIYNMNAKISSGIQELMNNSDLYNITEDAVLAFNRGNSDELSDQVILTYKNNFINYGVARNGNPAVAYLSTMPIVGFKEANINNPEVLKYKGSFGENRIKIGENVNNIDKEVSKEAYLGKLTETLKSTISEYNAKLATKLSSSKSALIEALKNDGEDVLAAKVEERGDITSLEDEIEKKGGDFVDLYENYKKVVDKINPATIPADYFIEAINKEVITSSKCDLNALKENRVKKNLEITNDKTSPTATYDNSNGYSDKSNNVIDGKNEISISDNNEFIDQSEQGFDSVYDYVNTPGAYRYDGVIQNRYMDSPYTEAEKNQMTPSQIWKEMMKADIELPELATDYQLQQKFKEASTGKGDSFKEAWEVAINEVLVNVYYNGQEELNELSQKYNMAMVGTNDSYIVDYDYDGIDDIEFENKYSNNSNENVSYAEDGNGYASVVR